MKNAPARKSDKSALIALKSKLIIAASNPTIQQAFALLALMTFALREVML